MKVNLITGFCGTSGARLTNDMNLSVMIPSNTVRRRHWCSKRLMPFFQCRLIGQGVLLAGSRCYSHGREQAHSSLRIAPSMDTLLSWVWALLLVVQLHFTCLHDQSCLERALVCYLSAFIGIENFLSGPRLLTNARGICIKDEESIILHCSSHKETWA